MPSLVFHHVTNEYFDVAAGISNSLVLRDGGIKRKYVLVLLNTTMT